MEELEAIKIFRLQCNFYKDITQAYKSLNEENKAIIRRKFPSLLKDEKRRKRRNKDKSSYYSIVWKHTENNSFYIENIAKRGFMKYDIDHIVPISYGYKNNIPPELIGSLENLRVISNRDNIAKGDKITDDSKVILELWKKQGKI